MVLRSTQRWKPLPYSQPRPLPVNVPDMVDGDVQRIELLELLAPEELVAVPVVEPPDAAVPDVDPVALVIP